MRYAMNSQKAFTAKIKIMLKLPYHSDLFSGGKTPLLAFTPRVKNCRGSGGKLMLKNREKSEHGGTLPQRSLSKGVKCYTGSPDFTVNFWQWKMSTCDIFHCQLTFFTVNDIFHCQLTFADKELNTIIYSQWSIEIIKFYLLNIRIWSKVSMIWFIAFHWFDIHHHRLKNY